MNTHYHYKKENIRILSLVPTSRGTGYVVVETPPLLLCERSVIGPRDDKEEAVEDIRKVIAWNRPDVVLLEDIHSQHFRRKDRTREIIGDVEAIASGYGMSTQAIAREEVFAHFEVPETAAKAVIVERAVEILDEPSVTKLVPSARRLWGAEPHWMPMFEALVLIITALKAD